MTVRIGVAINTLNEETNLGFALRSVYTWADDIVVVDMHSEDGTIGVAESYGARVISHERLRFPEPARQVAIDALSSDWVLVLDADEVVPPELASRLQEVAEQNAADVVHIPYMNYFLGDWMRFTFMGLFNEKHLRFFRRGYAETSPVIHRGLRAHNGAREYTLPRKPEFAMQHFGYVDLEHFAEKIDRYTTIEAEQMFVRGENAGTRRMLRAALGEFLTHYVRFGGIFNGWRGFQFSAYMAYYYAAKYGKLRALHEVGSRDDVRKLYADAAERWLAGYKVSEAETST